MLYEIYSRSLYLRYIKDCMFLVPHERSYLYPPHHFKCGISIRSKRWRQMHRFILEKYSCFIFSFFSLLWHQTLGKKMTSASFMIWKGTAIAVALITCCPPIIFCVDRVRCKDTYFGAMISILIGFHNVALICTNLIVMSVYVCVCVCVRVCICSITHAQVVLWSEG